VVVGLAQVHLRIEGAQSLKDKRQVLRGTLDRLRRLGVSASEVGDHDLWNRATVGLACVSNQAGHAQSLLQAALNIFDELASAEVEAVESDVIRFGA
jgi:uncharacterized protein YlxP (DUF503 family)